MPSRRPFWLLVDPIEEMAAILAALNLIVIFMQMFPFLSSKQCLEMVSRILYSQKSLFMRFSYIRKTTFLQ